MDRPVMAVGRYQSPLGEILLHADDLGLTGARFRGQEDFPAAEAENPAITAAKAWLDIYFSGREPDFLPPLHPVGTAFQREVWEILRTIPYGKTMAYGEIAGILAARRGLRRMPAQAVGGAVGRNPVGIFIPCHRVIGTSGSLTGYAYGLERKKKLLELEGTNSFAGLSQNTIFSKAPRL